MTRDPENVKAIFVSHASSFEIASYRYVARTIIFASPESQDQLGGNFPFHLLRDSDLIVRENMPNIGFDRVGCFEPLLGLGIFTARGEPWRHSRALLRPQFAREQISDMDLDERHFNTLSGMLKTEANGWTEVVNLQPIFLKMTLGLMTEFLYGDVPSHTSQKTDAPDVEEFEYHFDAGKSYLGTRMTLGKWHWLFHSPKFFHHCEKAHEYVDYIVGAKLQRDQTKSTTEKAPQESTTKGKFVLLDELAEQTNNALEIRNETLNILSAGRDTTASLLTWVFYLLSRSPRVFNQLRTTVLAEIGTDASSVEFKKLRSCRYLQHVIDETLRIIGILPTMEREAIEDTVLPRGGGPDGSKPVFLPKGQRVLISVYAMMQRCDIWGDDPEVFRPERFEGRKAGFEFIPFGGGPRKCVGRKRTLS